MAKKHFSGKGKNKIHTSRSPACGKRCAYKKAAPNKFAHQPQAAHHIIPVATFVDYQVEEDYEDVVSEITSVYRATDYCANRPKNLINLPRKTTYSKKRKTKAGGWPAVWRLNLPCHNWDHYQYNEEVRQSLREKIWSKFLKKKPPVPCPDEEAVATSFDAIEDAFHTQLTVTCPSRNYGNTLLAIEAGEAKKPNWWHAFSMAMKVRDEPVFVFATESAVPIPALLR
jgi:hypothetical protein